ncbi:hypothetical protein KXS07_03980 [Inquilinus limosus]|uniref:hypothetical protein n=1 Tax=Inquilinus limosus TaxID=171674 RepID=UPI003F159A8D
MKSDRPLLKVYFRTAMDLSRFATENSFNVMNTTFFCDRPETSPYMSFPSIYQNGARVGDAKIFGQPVNGSFGEYYIFIDISRPRVVPSKPPQNGYDLRNENGDVCFQLSGGSGFRGFRSNVVAIPRRAIEGVLAQMEPQSRS